MVRPEGHDGSAFRMPVLGVDEDFLDTYGITLLAGRHFSGDIASDLREAFILNETAVRRFGWTDPIGKGLAWNNRKGTVIGVIKQRFCSVFEWVKLGISLEERPDLSF